MALDTRQKRMSMLNFGQGWTAVVLFEADGAVDADDRAHMPDLYSGITLSGGIVFVQKGREWIFTSPNWSQVEHFFEVYIRVSSGSGAEARLFDVTAGAPVSGSSFRTSSATFVRLRSAALDLTDGSSYRVEVGSDASSAGEALFAGLVSI